MFEQIIWNIRRSFMRYDAAIGVVEIILILLVLVGLVLIFKEQIVSIANSIFTDIDSQIDGI